jgi:23S rRNA (cytidine1920-2'-O)/16S rRNA (cytidine1409-2'-O)-methyltransferase
MSGKKPQRLDDMLIQLGFFESLAQARSSIMAGHVIVNDQRIDKPGSSIGQDAIIRIKGMERFVSRGGEKLLAAITALNLKDDFIDKVILDVGASTGGFTDCVLQLGAKTSIALDVGTAQLDWKLRSDPRVIAIEKTDIKEFDAPADHVINWVLADVSFTSLAKLIPYIRKSAPKARLLLLVKPQFELPREKIPDGGIVTDDQDRALALELVVKALKSEGYTIEQTLDAPVAGRQGNREIFVLAK